MHIKKLEISGFKSFVDRSVIHFDHDIIGIVGPNGCGKSNIVDAIRWCMGEQSAKHLRGRSMADVIFSGSQSRGSAGLAEVTLTFDNTDKEAATSLPLEYRDWAEIAITRRLYRDGTSEYLVNKTQVRLKDITDLFLGTGVGTKAYSIIEQGKIGLIVSARAEDRRVIIEEAAGITKYKARRKQAEQKMDLTRQNLLRVGDIVSEIERSLASLRRQSAKAERYLAYRKELDDLVLCESSHRFLELTVVGQVERSLRDESHEVEQRVRTDLGTREADLAVLRQTAQTAEGNAERAHDTAYRADNEVRLHQAEIDRAIEKTTALTDRIASERAEADEQRARLVHLEGERDSLTAICTDAESVERGEQDAMVTELEVLDGLRQSESEAEQVAARLRADVSTSHAKVAGAEATMAGHARRQAELTQRYEKLEDELGRLAFEIEDHALRKETIAREIGALAEGKRVSEEQRQLWDAELKSLREAAIELSRVLESEKGELSGHRSRLRALEELHERLEGVGQGVKALMAKKDANVVGLVADRFEPSAELTRAFTSVLDHKLEWCIVKDPRSGAALLAQLERDGLGRATVLAERPPYVAGKPRYVAPDGVEATRLADAIAFEPSDAALAESLFGDVLVVADADAAFALRDAGCRETIVTRGGMVFGRDGAICGGTGDSVMAALVEQKREMRELHETIAALGDRVSRTLEAHQQNHLRITEVGAKLEAARFETHQGELKLVAASEAEKRAAGQLETAEARKSTVVAELAEVKGALEASSTETEAAEAVLGEGRAALTEATEALSHADAVAGEHKAATARQQVVVTDRKVALAQVRERALNARNTLERIARSCEEMSARIGRLEQSAIECFRAVGETAARHLLARESLFGAVSEARAAEADLGIAKAELDAARVALADREVDLKDLRDQVEATAEARRAHEANLTRLEIELEHLLSGVRERFRGLELATIVGDFHKRPPVDATHRERIRELGDLIDRMGPVNLDAVKEHTEAEERYTYYTTQRDDLDKALADLEQAITQMNRETKRLFRDAFDGINARFKVLFPKMFRGGQAELRLSNPEDMLETGIEILAQPPGKKLSSIELMSGGEKALTAVSLIFAIFQFKPSPFCILDEVDAPLDEANVTRYNEAIRSMTERSQFILITHIKRTMQSVDVLYGVTMQEPGVSKLVSVKVNDTAESRSSKVPPASTVNPEGEAAEEKVAVA